MKIIITLLLFLGLNAQANSSEVYGKWNAEADAEGVHYSVIMDIQMDRTVSTFTCSKGNTVLTNSVSARSAVTDSQLISLESKYVPMESNGVNCDATVHKTAVSYSVHGDILILSSPDGGSAALRRVN